jgi:hypothetical protein
MQNKQPFVEGDMGALKQCPDRDGELLIAILAFVQARAMGFATKLCRATDHAAMRANGTIRPKLAFQKLAGLVLENRVSLIATIGRPLYAEREYAIYRSGV